MTSIWLVKIIHRLIHLAVHEPDEQIETWYETQAKQVIVLWIRTLD